MRIQLKCATAGRARNLSISRSLCWSLRRFWLLEIWGLMRSKLYIMRWMDISTKFSFAEQQQHILRFRSWCYYIQHSQHSDLFVANHLVRRPPARLNSNSVKHDKICASLLHPSSLCHCWNNTNKQPTTPTNTDTGLPQHHVHNPPNQSDPPTCELPHQTQHPISAQSCRPSKTRLACRQERTHIHSPEVHRLW